MPGCAQPQRIAAIVSPEAWTVRREQRQQDTCENLLNNSPEQGLLSLHSWGKGLQESLALNAKDAGRFLPVHQLCLCPP